MKVIDIMCKILCQRISVFSISRTDTYFSRTKFSEDSVHTFALYSFYFLPCSLEKCYQLNIGMEEKGQIKGIKPMQYLQCYPHHLFDRETKSSFSSATRNSPLPAFYRTIVQLAKYVRSKIEHRVVARWLGWSVSS